ncbi:MAG: ABC transporter ATP-binding protein [Chloroflexota bacterium]
MTTITVEHISKAFAAKADGTGERTPVLHDINFKISEGEVLAILGPSGCGKSTLLRIVAGLIPPDEGRILYDNVPLDLVEQRDRGIGMVFQEGALIPHWESGRSVGFFLSLRKRAHEVPERVQRISKITGIGLDVLLDKRPAHLSGGEKQRVSLARALTRDLQILLMDEPFANIDAKLRATARLELKRLMDEFPTTAIYVTHDQIEAVSLSRRVAVMNAGRIAQIGTYQQLYENPVNLFVATFIGTVPMNLFPGFAISGQWKGDSFGGYDIRGDLEEGTRVTMGVRPEHIMLAGAHDDNVAAGEVKAVTPYFAERYQLLEVRGNGENWLMHVPPDYPVRPKDTVRCAIAPDNLRFFDPVSEKRIG